MSDYHLQKWHRLHEYYHEHLSWLSKRDIEYNDIFIDLFKVENKRLFGLNNEFVKMETHVKIAQEIIRKNKSSFYLTDQQYPEDYPKMFGTEIYKNAIQKNKFYNPKGLLINETDIHKNLNEVSFETYENKKILKFARAKFEIIDRNKFTDDFM